MISAAIAIAIVWWVYMHITSQPDMIMNKVFLFLDDKTSRVHTLNKLVNCEYCLAGFSAMVMFPFMFEYNILNHIFFISLSILTVHILNTFLSDEKG